MPGRGNHQCKRSQAGLSLVWRTRKKTRLTGHNNQGDGASSCRIKFKRSLLTLNCSTSLLHCYPCLVCRSCLSVSNTFYHLLSLKNHPTLLVATQFLHLSQPSVSKEKSRHAASTSWSSLALFSSL